MTSSLVKNGTFPVSHNLGIGIVESPECKTWHIGIIYNKNGQTWLIHLAWDCSLKDEPIPENFYWGLSSLDNDERALIASYVPELKNNKDIRYAFINKNKIVFDTDGKYIIRPPGEGLTCATFVMEVFEWLYLPVVDQKSWETRDTDQPFFDCILKFLKKQMSDDYIKHIEENRDVPRFRPEEIAAGVISDEFPLSFQKALKISRKIVSEINS